MPEDLPSVYLAGGVTREELDDAVRSGLWERLRRGAYAELPPDLDSWERRRLLTLARGIATARQLRGGICLSHLTAAAFHGLPIWREPTKTYVIQRSHVRSGLPADVVRSVAELPDEDIVVIEGMRVTSLTRTMLDCARSLHPRDGLTVVDGGLRALVKPERNDRARAEREAEEIRGRLLDALPRGARGRVRAAAVIDASVPFAESAPESVLRWIAITHGLPRPETQHEVKTAFGPVWTDMAWPRLDGSWLHVEFDGAVKYRVKGQTPESAARILMKEKRREEAIIDASTGRVRDDVVRFEYGEVWDERAAWARLAARFSHEDRALWTPDRERALHGPRRHPTP